MDPTSQWDDGWADGTLRPSPSGNALSDAPPLSSSSTPHSGDVAVSRFANTNRNVIDVADPGSHPGRNVVATLQEWLSYEEIGRSTLLGEHNRDTMDASSPARVTGQRSREKPHSGNPLRGAETKPPQTAAESSEPDVKLNVRPGDSQTEAPTGADNPQWVFSGPVVLARSYSISEPRAMQDGPISLSASMQLGIQPRPTTTPPASQNIPSIPAAQVSGSDPALGLPKTTSPGKTNLPSHLRKAASLDFAPSKTITVLPSGRPASFTYLSPPSNQWSVSISQSPPRAASVLTKTLTTQAGRPKGTDELNPQPEPVPLESRYRLDDGKGKGIPDDDGRKNASEIRSTLPQTPGRPSPASVASSPPQPASVQPRLERSYSRMQGNYGAEHESKRTVGESTVEKVRERPSTPTTQAGRAKGTDELNPRPLDDEKGKGIPGENGLKYASETRTTLPQTLEWTVPPPVPPPPQPASVQLRLDRSYSPMQGKDGTEHESELPAGGLTADDTLRPSPSGNALSNVPPLSSSSAPHSGDVVVSRSASINTNTIDMADPGSHLGRNVAAEFQERPSHEEIGRITLLGEHNRDTTGASIPATALLGQRSQEKPHSESPSRVAETNLFQTAAESSEPDVKLNVWPGDIQTEAPISADDPQWVFSGPVVPAKSYGKSQPQAIQDGFMSSSASMQLGAQPRSTPTHSVSQNIPSIPAAQVSGSDPALGLPKTTSPGKTNLPSHLRKVVSLDFAPSKTIAVLPSGRPASFTYFSSPLNQWSVSISQSPPRAASALTKTLTTQAGRPKGTDELNPQPEPVPSESRYRLDDGKGKGIPDDDGRKNVSEIRSTLPQTLGRPAPASVASSPPQPASRKPHFDRSYFRMQGNYGAQRESKRAAGEPTAEKGRQRPSTPTTQVGRAKGTDELNPRPLDDGKGKGIPGQTAPPPVPPPTRSASVPPRLDRSYSPIQGKDGTEHESKRPAGGLIADDTLRPSPPGNALSDAPPLSSSSSPHSSDVAVFRSANINWNVIDMADPGSHPGRNVVATLQEWLSYGEIRRSTLSGEHNRDTTGASSPAMALGQRSREKPRSKNPLRVVETKTPQTADESSEPDVKLDVRLSDSQTEAPTGADNPQWVISGPVGLARSYSISEPRAMQDGPISSSPSMQLGIQPRPTATPPASQNILSVPAAQVARSDPALGLPKTTSPGKTNQSPLPPQESNVFGLRAQQVDHPASIQPTASSTYFSPPLNQPSVPMSMPPSRAGLVLKNAFTTQGGRPKGTDELNPWPGPLPLESRYDHDGGKGKGIRDDDGRKNTSDTRRTLPQTPGQATPPSAPPQPAFGQPRLDKSNSPMQGDAGMERESKRTAGESNAENGQERPSTPTTQVGRPKGTDELYPWPPDELYAWSQDELYAWPPDDGNGKGIPGENGRKYALETQRTLPQTLGHTAPPPVPPPPPQPTSLKPHLYRSYSPMQGKDGTAHEFKRPAGALTADDTLRPSPSGNALSDVPPLSLSSSPHSSDVAVSGSVNINRNVIDMADPGSHPGRNVAAELQEQPSHEEIGRSTLSGEHNWDATDASSPTTAIGQRSQEKPPSKNPLRGAETKPPQTAAESSEPDVKLNVRPGDSQTEAPTGADNPQWVISGPVGLARSYSISEPRAMQDGPISSLPSMQLGIQPRPTATPPASQNIPSIPAAQVSGSDPALGLPKTTSPWKTNRSPLPPQEGSVFGLRAQQVDRTASVQPTTPSTYFSPPLNKSSVSPSMPPSRAAPVLGKAFTIQGGRPKGKGIRDDDGRKNTSETGTTLPQTPGRAAPPSAPPHPASGQPHLDKSNSPMQGDAGTERESKRTAGESTAEKGQERPSTPTTQAGKPMGTDYLNARPGPVPSEPRYHLDNGKGEGIPDNDSRKNASETRTTLPQTLGHPAPPSVPSSPPQPASGQPRLDRSYSRVGNDRSEHESKRGAGELIAEKGRERPSAPTTQAGRPKGADELDPRPLDDGKGKGIPGRAAPPSAPPQPASGQPHLDKSNSPMQGDAGTERESKRTAGESTAEKGREMPSTPKDRQTDVEDHSDSPQRQTSHALDNILHPKIAPESSVERTHSSSPSQGNDSSAPHPPDTGESRRRVGESPDSPPSIKRTETPITFPRDALPSTQNQPELRSVPSSNNETAPGAQDRPRQQSVGDSQIPDIRSGKLSIINGIIESWSISTQSASDCPGRPRKANCRDRPGRKPIKSKHRGL
ncbi:hypothetical protein BC827DRAFT_249181 [Russula dissimulans]|nr:hypothetical protein BC827DRAFT_249181 [Russula dissimulans]